MARVAWPPADGVLYGVESLAGLAPTNALFPDRCLGQSENRFGRLGSSPHHIKQLVMASQSLPTFSPDMLTRMEPGMLTDEMKEGKTQQHTPIVLLDAGRWLRARASAPHNCVI